jgi:hypothetical protein
VKSHDYIHSHNAAKAKTSVEMGKWDTGNRNINDEMKSQPLTRA